VPAKDAAATIATTVQSLAPEHAVVGRVILADDQSGDGTAEIAASAAAAADLPLTVIRGAWNNAGGARNAAIAAATGDYVYLLDADDEVAEGGLRALVECLQSDRNAGLAIGGYLRRTHHGQRRRMPGRLEPSRPANAHNYLRNQLRSIAIGSALARRACLDGIRFPEKLQFEEDVCFWTALLTRADVSAVARTVLVYNVAEGRGLKRLTTDPRGAFLTTSAELGRLAKFGIDDDAVKWRRAWLARRIARAHIRTGDLATARKFLRAVWAHPQLRHAPTTLRYALRIRLSETERRLARAIGLAAVGGRTGPP